MSVLSRLKPAQSCITNGKMLATLLTAVRHGHKRVMVVEPTRFQWHKFKDLFHFYFMVAAIPLTALVFGVNVFIGPATLAEIPEGYEPKHWEYYKHPIERWMAKYIYPSPQETYEKWMHNIYEEEEKRLLRKLSWAVEDKMKLRADYQAYYYRPMLAKYHRYMAEQREYFKEVYPAEDNN